MSKKRLPSRENNEMNPCTRPMRKPGSLWMFGTICVAYEDATNKPKAKRKNHFILRLPKVESRVVAGGLPRNNLLRACESATIGQDTSRRAPRRTSTYCDTSAQRHRGTAGWCCA